MTKQEIIEKVNNLLIEEFEIAEDLLTPEASLKSDLEIDSLDFVDIVVLIDRDAAVEEGAAMTACVSNRNPFRRTGKDRMTAGDRPVL